MRRKDKIMLQRTFSLVAAAVAVTVMAVVCAGPALAVVVVDDQFNVDGTIDPAIWQNVGAGAGPPVATPVSGGELLIDSNTQGSYATESITTFQVPAAGSGQFLQLDTKYRDTSGAGVGEFSIRFLEDITVRSQEMNLFLAHQDRPTNSTFGDYWLRSFNTGITHNHAVTDHTLPLAGGSTTAMEWIRVTVENVGPGMSDINLLTSPDGVAYTNIDSVSVGEFTNDLNVTFTADRNYPGGNDTQIALDFVTVTLVGSPIIPIIIDTFSWRNDTPGDWATSTNWTPSASPSGPDGNDKTAIFGDAISKNTTVFSDEDKTVKSVQFDDDNSYIIAGAGTISLDGGSASASITVADLGSAVTHEFQSRVALVTDTDADIATGTTLEFNNRLSLAGNTLTKVGGGTLAVNNNLSTGGGTLQHFEGSIVGGGTIAGDVNIFAGTVSPGDATGSGNLVSVPEPSSLVLLGFSLLLLVPLGGYAIVGR